MLQMGFDGFGVVTLEGGRDLLQGIVIRCCSFGLGECVDEFVEEVERFFSYASVRFEDDGGDCGWCVFATFILFAQFARVSGSDG